MSTGPIGLTIGQLAAGDRRQRFRAVAAGERSHHDSRYRALTCGACIVTSNRPRPVSRSTACLVCVSPSLSCFFSPQRLRRADHGRQSPERSPIPTAGRVPGVTVEARSRSRQGTRHERHDVDGVYRFALLLPVTTPSRSFEWVCSEDAARRSSSSGKTFRSM